MDVIEEVYADLDADISLDEFRDAVAEKVEQMGGLADDETAAMLIAHELEDNGVNNIADIEPGQEEVKFLGKVVTVGRLREFDRDDSEETGRVVNVQVADETGSIRCAFWDEMAEAATDELQPGEVLRIKGRPRDGYDGVEVSVNHAETEEDAEIDVPVGERYQVADLTMGRSDVTIQGQVLDVDEAPRTFDRDDGSEGRVGNLVLGDETGRVRVTLWDDQTAFLEEFEPGDTIEVIDGYVRDRDGDLELHVGRDGTIEATEDEVEYVPDATPIADVELEETVDIAGVVRSADPKRTFDRDDGSEGQVRNIRVQDESGDIRVALWGDKADREIAPGDEVQLADVEIQDGWQDEVEASAGWRSTVTVLSDGSVTGNATKATQNRDGENDGGGSSRLEEFSGAEPSDPGEDAVGGSNEDAGERVEVTGVVVQVGDPIIIDTGDETLSVDTDKSVTLGEELTVQGIHRGDRLDAVKIT